MRIVGGEKSAKNAEFGGLCGRLFCSHRESFEYNSPLYKQKIPHTIAETLQRAAATAGAAVDAMNINSRPLPMVPQMRHACIVRQQCLCQAASPTAAAAVMSATRRAT